MTSPEPPAEPPTSTTGIRPAGSTTVPNGRFGLVTIMWTIVGTGLTSVITIGALVITLYSWLNDDIKTLRSELRTESAGTRTELRDDIKGFEEAVRSDFDDVRGRIHNLQGTATNTVGRVSNIEGQITGITTSIAGINTEIAALQQNTMKTDSMISKFEGFDLIAR